MSICQDSLNISCFEKDFAICSAIVFSTNTNSFTIIGNSIEIDYECTSFKIFTNFQEQAKISTIFARHLCAQLSFMQTRHNPLLS